MQLTWQLHLLSHTRTPPEANTWMYPFCSAFTRLPYIHTQKLAQNRQAPLQAADWRASSVNGFWLCLHPPNKNLWTKVKSDWPCLPPDSKCYSILNSTGRVLGYCLSKGCSSVVQFGTRIAQEQLDCWTKKGRIQIQTQPNHRVNQESGVVVVVGELNHIHHFEFLRGRRGRRCHQYIETNSMARCRVNWTRDPYMQKNKASEPGGIIGGSLAFQSTF